ncbi:ROK family glucokinase [Micrococcales bacterium 31B]|nr:ROK family glucokinase [Micrococcales bacterium 31B]
MYSIGVDIGGTKIAAGLVSAQGEIVAQTRRPTPSDDPTKLEALVAEAVLEVAGEHEISGVGVAAAGFVDAAGEKVIFAPNLAWRNHPLAERVRALVPFAVHVDNDANAAGWAEYQFGAARAANDMLMLTVGTGLGGAMVTNGNLVRGAYGFAAEVGHLRVVPHGHRCGCGMDGCWEQYVSGNALVRDARQLLSEGGELAAGLLDVSGGDADRVNGPMITTLAKAGDPGCVALLQELGRWLGEGAASVVNLLDSDVVVIGGGVSDAGALLLEPAQEAFTKCLTARAYRTPARVVLAEMGNDAGMVGAADLARLAAQGH